MEQDKKCFSVTWRVENYNFFSKTEGKYFFSPSFVIDSLKDTSWAIEIYPNSACNADHILLYVNKKSGFDVDYRFDCEISFLADDSSSIYEGTSHMESDQSYSSSFYVPHHKVYIKERGELLPPKTLTIRCKIYKSQDSLPDKGKCFIRTRIQVERSAFFGLAERFASLIPGEKRILLIKSSSTEEQLLTLNLNLAEDTYYNERVWIEIIPVERDYIKFCKCKLFLVDSEGRKTKCGRSEITLDETEPQEWKFPLNFSKSYLMRKNSQFLSNDTLTLKCEFAFSTGIEYQAVENSEFGNLAFFTENRIKLPCALDDLACLYEEGILCDTVLKTETETFNCHKNILSARSSVFKTMFTTDMREKTTDFVHIEDLEADTVRRMLMFLYSDNLEDLDWESAKSLYFAADKYNIVILKHKCSEFLLNNLQPSESCDLMLLSDRHQDEKLKKAVQKYITEHHEEIFLTDQWMNLEKSNPVLTTETFRALYMRNYN